MSQKLACHVQHQSCSFTSVLFHPQFPLVLWWHNSLILPYGKCVCVMHTTIHCLIACQMPLNYQRFDQVCSVELLLWEEEIRRKKNLALIPNLLLNIFATFSFNLKIHFVFHCVNDRDALYHTCYCVEKYRMHTTVNRKKLLTTFFSKLSSYLYHCL